MFNWNVFAIVIHALISQAVSNIFFFSFFDCISSKNSPYYVGIFILIIFSVILAKLKCICQSISRRPMLSMDQHRIRIRQPNYCLFNDVSSSFIIILNTNICFRRKPVKMHSCSYFLNASEQLNLHLYNMGCIAKNN